MVNSKGFAACGGVLGLVGIFEIVRHSLVLGGGAFLLAVGCALGANVEWRRKHS